MSAAPDSDSSTFETLLGQAVETSRMGLWSLSSLSRKLRLDSRSIEIHGLQAPCGGELELELETFLGAVHCDDRERLRDTLLAECPAGFRDLEYRVQGDHSHAAWVRLSGDVQRNSDDESMSLVGSCFDISEGKKVHRQLLQAQKMEAIGQLTAGIAHNFNNILSAILPSLHLVMPHVRPEGTKLIRNAQLAAERATDLVAELMVVAGRKTGLAREPLDLVEIAERVVRICRTTFGGWVQLNFDCSVEIPHIVGCESQIEQVLLNLLLNARDAFEEGSTSCPNIDIDIDVEEEEEEEEEIVMRFMDNGPGMSSATAQRIFEPFFTTKGSGTGLGLATAYAITVEHGGSIVCWSKPGRGTEFVLRFPIHRGDIPMSEERSLLPYVGGSERVLVVDDDALVRRVTSLALREAGYEVLESSSGRDALVKQRAAESIDLVLLDMAMPELSGDQVVQAMRSRDPEIKVLIFTGLSDASASTMGGVAVLHKPVGVNELLLAVRSAIDQPTLL